MANIGPNIIIPPGHRFGRLTVIKETEKKGKRRYLLCKCDCGVVKNIRLDSLRRGAVVSCGCFNREISIKANTKHGMCYSRIYNTHKAMKARCLNKNNSFYKNYGGRGISICKDWLDFEAFYAWSKGSGYKSTLTIERTDVNGNYCPSNCTWATMDEQKRNTTVSKRITFNGKTMTQRQWAKEIGLCHSTISRRFSVGLSIEEALSPKKRSTHV